LTHGRVFDDEAFAERYAERHQKIVERFGHEYAEKLVSRGFHGGRIIDVGCGYGAMNIVLAHRFADSEIVGMDLIRSTPAAGEPVCASGRSGR
jgi:methylase of polypeptide subunit release factors